MTRHDDPPERTTPLDKIGDHTSCEDGCPQPHLVKQAQGLAGELLWLVVRCRPDLSYPVNLMWQCMLKNPQLALNIGAQILGYLKSAKHWGIKYLLTRTLDTLEVQTDSGFAQSHLDMRSEQGVILLWGGSPIHWSSTRQPFICRSTAESELVATLEGVAVGESYGEVVHSGMVEKGCKVLAACRARCLCRG